jgi:hypothetical protein
LHGRALENRAYSAAMKILFSILAFSVLSFSSFADSTPDQLMEQVAVIIKEWSAIKPGTTTRAELKKTFGEEGGISNATHRTYVSKHCPYVKVDVVFVLAKPEQGFNEGPDDTIKSISKPYLQYSISD